MKKMLFSVIALLAFSPVFAQNWNLDKAHAKLGFHVTHMLISDVDGYFRTFDVKLTAAKEDFTDAKIELTAETKSIWTDNDKRDEHLRNADFFNVEKNPTLTFTSRSFKKIEGKKYQLIGDLTMNGVTKIVFLDVIYNGTINHPYMNKPVAGFKITGTVKRSDFGVGTSFAAQTISDEIEINANAEFIKE